MPDRMSITLGSVDKTALVRNESYLALISLGGHKYFAIVAYKGGGKLAQDDEPDVYVEDTVFVFEKPKESMVRRARSVAL